MGSLHQATAVALPAGSRITGFYEATNLADAFAIGLPNGTLQNPETLARFLFAARPAWIGHLMQLRDTLVAGFGLKTARRLTRAAGQRVGIFKVYETHADEIILGEDDKHLDFRVSVLVRPGDANSQLVVSTMVHCHNLLGRAYITLIAPFHRRVVLAHLQRAAQLGWPRQG
jgi:hypothetical protein